MTVKVVTTVLSDLSGKEGARPRRFAVGEQIFEMDLLDAEWENFRKQMTEKARKVKRRPGRLAYLHSGR